MDTLTVIVLSLCAIIPFVVAMVVFAIVIYPARFASAIKDLKQYQANQLSGPTEAKRPVKLTIFVVISMIGICVLIGSMLLMLAWYLSVSLHLPS